MAVTSPPDTASQPTPTPAGVPARPPLVSARGGLAASLVLAGALHLVVAAGRGADWRAEGIALAVAGVAQVLLGIGVVASDRHALLWVATVLSTASASAWLVTRTAGYPIGPLDGLAPDPGGLEILVLAAELAAATLAAAALLTHGRLLGPAGTRWEVLAPVAVVVVAIPGLAVSGWADQAAHGPLSEHSHAAVVTGVPLSTLTPSERAQLGAELVAVRDLAVALPTLGDAREAGWSPVGGLGSYTGVLVVPPDPVRPGEPFDLARPLGLLYGGETAEAPVVAVEYAVWPDDGRAPGGFTGGDDVWHLHTGTCQVTVGSSTEAWVPLDEPLTGARCDAVGGALDPTTVWMLRVWAVPGWENPAGTFAHEHPALR